MRTDTSRPVRLDDYREPDWLVETVNLDIQLDPVATRVRARLRLSANPRAAAQAGSVLLDGDGLTLVALRIDGGVPPAESVEVTPDRLHLRQPPAGTFDLDVETLIDPSANSQLMGLYRSGGTYCTQCEAEGFRRITYFPDRPDIMAVYTTRIEARKADAEFLLANGNLMDAGDIPGTDRHFAIWHDPFPKPSYLFALVGGNLGCVEDRFVTASEREVALRIFVERGKEDRCAYALDSLKRAMRWDEAAFGREYDLDVFMIVAVSDFNMGAMENKGLNIFNDKYVLASADTATDTDYANIEAIIAHEYFHNWTGNRITCRDWFQLCLKEGLTVFRDQEFSSDQRSRPVKRIADVRALRTHQFAEDAGPLAHPVRPTEYREINNFYTATVYEKGAEIVRMLRTLLGETDFRRGMDLYFQRLDGTAATVDAFIQCFADASGRDLAQFMRWYSQSGTPRVTATGRYDEQSQTYQLDLAQILPPTPGQPVKEPMVIPLVTGLIGQDGRDLDLTEATQGRFTDGLLVLREAETRFLFTGVRERPVLSLNRAFSAPVRLATDHTDADLAFVAAHDADPFNRWQAIQTLAMALLMGDTEALWNGTPSGDRSPLGDAIAATLTDPTLEPAFVAQALSLPSEADIAREIGTDVDPDRVFAARTALRSTLGERLGSRLRALYETLTDHAPYSPDAASAGRRALRNACLDLLAATKSLDMLEWARAQYTHADNMTDRFAALTAVAFFDASEREAYLDDFYRRYQSDPLVVDKWLALQATIPDPSTLDLVNRLTTHPAFSLATPNRVRALVGSFAQSNPGQFNRPDGEGYRFVADVVLRLDATNPQIAARLLASFRNWRALEPGRRALAQQALDHIAGQHTLSHDVSDIVQRSLRTD